MSTADAYLAPGIPVLTLADWEALPEDVQIAYLAVVEELESTWRLQPHQRWADILADHVDETLYGGAVGGGKSELMIWRAHHLSMAIPDHRSLVLRSTFPELRRSLILRSILRIPTTKATYRVGDREWHYPNGAVIEFGHLDSDEDARIYLSAEYQAVFIDEATLMTPLQVTLVASRLRATKQQRRDGARPHLFCGTNPGGPGHAYFKRRYVDATDKGAAVAIWKADTDPDDPSTKPDRIIPLPQRPRHPGDWPAVERLEAMVDTFPRLGNDEIAVAYVPAVLDDNSYIDQAYRRRINAMPALERRQAYGDWDVFKGQYWSEWNPNVHIVAPFAIPEGWERAVGIDYGFWPHAFCALWVAWDQDGNAYVYREAYLFRTTAPDQAKAVVVQSGEEKIRNRVADPSVFTQTGIGDAISRQWQQAGLYVRKANNSRVDGWANVRAYMQVEEGTSKLRVFNNCVNLIRTIPDQLHSKTVPEDMDTKGEDDALDALRYALATRPWGRRSIQRKYRGSTLQEVESQHLANIKKQGRRRMSPWRTA